MHITLLWFVRSLKLTFPLLFLRLPPPLPQGSFVRATLLFPVPRILSASSAGNHDNGARVPVPGENKPYELSTGKPRTQPNCFRGGEVKKSANSGSRRGTHDQQTPSFNVFAPGSPHYR
jgi:hypothetical protein